MRRQVPSRVVNECDFFVSPVPESWNSVKVSYLEILKASRSMSGHLDRYWRALGFRADESVLVQTFLLFQLALVYKADLLYERAQQSGKSVIDTHSWKSPIVDFLCTYRLYDEAIERNLDDLEKYAELEGSILLGEVELTEDVIMEALYLRSSDVHIATRALHRFKQVPYNEEAFLLRQRWLVLWEIFDDLGSYEQDRSRGSFNTLVLYEKLYGPRVGAERLRIRVRGVMAQLFDRIDQSASGSVVDFMLSVSSRDLTRGPVRGLLAVLPRPLLVRAAKLVVRQEGEKDRHLLPGNEYSDPA